MRTPEPERPEPSESAAAWLEERLGACFTVPTRSDIGDDAPADVLAWLDAFHTWRDAREAWGKAQPFEHAPDRPSWRMFGGPWIPWRYDVEMMLADGTCYAWLAWRDIEKIVAAGWSDEVLRELAAAVYKRKAMREKADAVLVDALRRVGLLP